MSARRLVVNAVSGGGLWASEAVIAFVMTPVLLTALGKEGYGIWALLGTFVGYMGLLDLGLSPAIMRNVAFASGQGEAGKPERIVGTAIVALGAMGILAAGILLVLSRWAPEILNVPRDTPNLDLLFVIFAGLVLVGFIRAAVTSALLGLQSHTLVNVIRVVTNLLRATIVYIGLTSGVGDPLLYLATVHLAATVVQFVFMLMAARKEGLANLAAVRSANWATAKDLLSFGAKSTLGMGGIRLIKQGILLVIAQVSGPAKIVFYTIPSQLFAQGDSMLGAVSFPLTAYLANVVGKGGEQAVAVKWRLSTRVLQCLAFWMTLGIAFLGLPFLSRWVGAEVARNSRAVLYVIVGIAVVRAFNTNTNRLLQSLNRHGSSAAFASVAGLVSLGLAIPLCLWLGVTGAAVALLFFTTVHALFEIHLVSRTVGESPLPYLWGAVRRFTLPVLAGSGAFLAMRAVLLPTGYAEIALHVLVGSAAYFATAWFLAFTPEERKTLRAALTRGRREAAGRAPS